MEKVTVLNLKGNPKRDKIDLPHVFQTSIRPDLIKRAVLSEQSRKRQPQGRYPLAGRLVSHTSVGPGSGISKVPRTHGKRTHHGNRGIFINSTVGGKLAFPPKTEKKIVEKINKKEKKIALWSAVSATAIKDIVEDRGHLIDEAIKLPLIVEDTIGEVNKTKELIEIFMNIGLTDDIVRSKTKKVRAGKGKMRGRKYRRKIGPLLVIADDCEAIKAGNNIPGLRICKVQELTVELLAPGTQAGRLTVWTEKAIGQLMEWQ